MSVFRGGRAHRPAILIGVCALAWAAAVATGLVALWKYKMTPGTNAAAPSTWPVESIIERRPGRPTLVMFAHPHCPCTRASVAELSVLMTRARGGVDAKVVFMAPSDLGPEWTSSETWRRAADIPGVDVLRDVDGRESARFGASVSGQTVLYDGEGRLRFAGGITGARGHEGDNSGLRLAVAALHDQSANRASSPVFGCSLEGSAGP